MRRRAEAASRAAAQDRNRWQLKQQTQIEGEQRAAAQREDEAKQQQAFMKERQQIAQQAKMDEAEAERKRKTEEKEIETRSKELQLERDASAAQALQLSDELQLAVHSESMTLKQAIDTDLAKIKEKRTAGEAVSVEERRKEAALKKAADHADRVKNLRLIVRRNPRFADYTPDELEAQVQLMAQSTARPPLEPTEKPEKTLERMRAESEARAAGGVAGRLSGMFGGAVRPGGMAPAPRISGTVQKSITAFMQLPPDQRAAAFQRLKQQVDAGATGETREAYNALLAVMAGEPGA
jgi:hypothetical protein